MEVGIVPDNMATDMANSSVLTPAGAISLFSGPSLQMPLHFSPMDREARVLRYKEKKKNRKFEKTIRYATRKTYAEARPRIKGRFAKRSDMDTEVDQMFSTAIIPEINQIVSDLPLPTIKGLVFSQSRLNWGNGYLCVSTDVTYNP